MITINIVSGASAIQNLAQEWTALIQGTLTEVFSHPAWYQARLDSSFDGKVAFITAREEGRLLGLLPLGRFRTDSRGLFFPLVSPIAIGDYQPPIILPERVPDVLPLLLDAARKHFRNPGTLWWPHIPSDDPSVPVIRRYCVERGLPIFEETDVAPRLRIDGLSFEELENGWPSSHRKDTRRQKKRLSEVGPVTLWEPANLGEAEPVLEEFFAVHDEKWLSQGFPGLFHSESLRRQFRETLRQLWGHGMYFTTVRCGTVDVSYHFGFRAGGWIQWYRPSYRTEYLGYSPGKIHISLIVEEACRQGLKGVDFLLGEEPYKLLWSNEIAQVVSLWVGSSKLSPSYLWFSQGKPYFRQRFGAHRVRAIAWLQKLRRRS